MLIDNIIIIDDMIYVYGFFSPNSYLSFNVLNFSTIQYTNYLYSKVCL